MKSIFNVTLVDGKQVDLSAGLNLLRFGTYGDEIVAHFESNPGALEGDSVIRYECKSFPLGGPQKILVKEVSHEMPKGSYPLGFSYAKDGAPLFWVLIRINFPEKVKYSILAVESYDRIPYDYTYVSTTKNPKGHFLHYFQKMLG